MPVVPGILVKWKGIARATRYPIAHPARPHHALSESCLPEPSCPRGEKARSGSPRQPVSGAGVGTVDLPAAQAGARAGPRKPQCVAALQAPTRHSLSSARSLVALPLPALPALPYHGLALAQRHPGTLYSAFHLSQLAPFSCGAQRPWCAPQRSSSARVPARESGARARRQGRGT
jgi:hypothetical protein